jgi:predicted flavoprotein YhiN
VTDRPEALVIGAGPAGLMAAEALAQAARLKALPARHAGLRPLDKAISTAGGIAASALDAGLGVIALPGIHAAGEMLDWEAPTGGHLRTACRATGLHAGRAPAGAGVT